MATTNTCEGTNGTNVSTSNSAGPNQFNAVTRGTSATLAYDTTHKAHGSTALKFAVGATAAGSEVAWNAFGNQSTIYGRFYFYATAAPAANHRVVSVIATGTAGLNAAIYWTTARKFQIVNSGGGGGTTSTATVTLNTWVRVEFKIVQSATVGQLEVKVFATADSTTATSTNTATNQNTFGTTIAYVGFGSNWDTKANVTAFWMDDLGIDTAAYLGPASTPATVTGAFTLAATAGPISLAGKAVVPGSLTLPAGAALAASGKATARGTLTMAAGSGLAAAGNATASGAASLTAGSALAAAGKATSAGYASLAAASGMALAGGRVVSGAFSLAASASLGLAGSAIRGGQFALGAGAGLALSGSAQVPGAATLPATGGATFGATVAAPGAFALTASSGLDAAGSATAAGTFDLAGESAADLTGAAVVPGSFSLGAGSGLALHPQFQRFDLTVLVGPSRLASYIGAAVATLAAGASQTRSSATPGPARSGAATVGETAARSPVTVGAAELGASVSPASNPAQVSPARQDRGN